MINKKGKTEREHLSIFDGEMRRQSFEDFLGLTNGTGLKLPSVGICAYCISGIVLELSYALGSLTYRQSQSGGMGTDVLLTTPPVFD